MNRIDRCFAELAGRKALIPFITAGDPNPGLTVALMDALVAGGADILELGVPFSDPMADGPVIQRASERALVHNVGLRDVLAMVADFRQHNATTPVVLMGYLNPIMQYGFEKLVVHTENLIDGILILDAPYEYREQFKLRLTEKTCI